MIRRPAKTAGPDQTRQADEHRGLGTCVGLLSSPLGCRRSMVVNSWAIGPHVQAPALSCGLEREEADPSLNVTTTRRALRLISSRLPGVSSPVRVVLADAIGTSHCVRRLVERDEDERVSCIDSSNPPSLVETSVMLVSCRPVSSGLRVVERRLIRRHRQRRCIRGPIGHTPEHRRCRSSRPRLRLRLRLRRRARGEATRHVYLSARFRQSARNHAPISQRVGAPLSGWWKLTRSLDAEVENRDLSGVAAAQQQGEKGD